MTQRQKTLHALALLCVLILGGVALYSNSARHVFHLDDHHSIESNPAIRSLANIPRFFVDAKAFSTLATNVDYRPVLLTSFALNHAFAGYNMPSWHWTQVGIHIWCAFFLYLFTLALLRISSPSEGAPAVMSESERVWIATLSALFFLVQPVNSGVVNYMAARSSGLTAAFLLAAFTLYLWERRAFSLIFFLLALFTKVEAVAALAVFWALSALRHRRVLGAPREWMPYSVAVLFYMAVRLWVMSGIDFAGAAAGPGATRFGYLCTQTTAWWEYLFNWFCPLKLVADNAAHPVFTRPWNLPVLLALVGWTLVILALWQARNSRPYLAVLAFSGLALISPTSSIVPLAEMMNEHRPYLPVALVSIVFVTGPVHFTLALRGGARYVAVGAIVLWLLCLAGLTWERNKVFLTSENYWADVLAKVPSGRAHNNYGLTLMATGRMVEAQKQFEDSVALSPSYSVAHINLAIVYARAKRWDEALAHYNLGVDFDRGTGDAQMWRGRYFLERAEYEKARADFSQASERSNDRYPVNVGLAQAYAGLGQPEESARDAILAGDIDFDRFGGDVVAVASPYFTSDAQATKGLIFFAALERRWPNVWWIPANEATLLKRLGRTKESAAKEARSQALKGQR